MTRILLPYGPTAFPLELEADRFSELRVDSNSEQPLSDVEIGAAFDTPIGSAPVDELINSDDSVLIVVSDATRATASAQIVNLLVRRLVQTGLPSSQISIIFATGIHRGVTEEEKVQLLTPFIVQRIKTLVHDAYDPSNLISLGQTESGVEVEVNRALQDFSKIILIGGIGFHYFAGFSGGRKSVCPGLASAKTIAATHMLALDFKLGGRKAGVGTGLLDGNAVHQECERVTRLVGPTFGINTIVDDKKQAVGVFCGDWQLAHRAACEHYLRNHSVEIESKRPLVIASCGGFPHDINMIQSHKAMDMAAHACADGGTIILLAQCQDGLGRPDFLKWFDSTDSRALEERLRTAYEVNGQTAWSLMTKAERFRVILVSDLPDDSVRKMRMIPATSLEAAMDQVDSSLGGYVMPRGTAVLPRVSAQ